MRLGSVKKQKRLVVLGIVMALGIVFLIYDQFITPKEKGLSVSPIPSELTEEEISESKISDVPEVAGKRSTIPKTWGRNPFALPPGVELRIGEEGELPEIIKPPIKKVTAILITGSRKVASINHQVVTVGDLIDGEKVLDIKPDRVVLKKGDRREVIMLE